MPLPAQQDLLVVSFLGLQSPSHARLEVQNSWKQKERSGVVLFQSLQMGFGVTGWEFQQTEQGPAF